MVVQGQTTTEEAGISTTAPEEGMKAWGAAFRRVPFRALRVAFKVPFRVAFRVPKGLL